MGKKNKKRSDLFKDYFKEHPSFDTDYNPSDTFDDLSLDSLITDTEQPLSIEDENLFESVGGENYIPSDASDISENNDIDMELGSLTEELSKRIPNNTGQKSNVNLTETKDEISDQIESAIAKEEKSTKAPQAPNKPLSKSKTAEKKVNLYDMGKAILEVNTLIRHDEGLYYYNGKCYSALRNDLQLLELIRSNVSFTGFAVTSTKPFQDLMTFLKTDPNLIPNKYEKKLEKARRLVALNNGVLDISTLELLDFDPKYLLFHHIDASWTKYQYPKIFLRFLRQSCNYDEEVVRLTAEAIGYLLSGSQAKAFFVIGTAPDSGKSTLASLITKLLGEEYTCSIEPNKLHERFSLGSTRGKILNMAMDIPQGRLCSAAVSKIKAITGQDSISIEEKYMRMEHTVSSLRFLFGTNHPITLSQTDSDDDAFWNRMYVIPFMRSVPPDEKDPTLLDKLWSERDAIVSFCLKSYQTVLNNGYVFSPCQASEDMKASWRRDDISTVSFANFWQDYVEVTGDLNDQIYSQVLYENYSFYCQDRRIDPVYYTKMREWIEAHTDPDMCIAKRLHRTGQNPRAGYCGIKVHY